MSKKLDQRSRLKKKYHKDKDINDGDADLDERMEEAARLGCEIWELDEIKKKMERQNLDSDDEDDTAKEKEESKE